jgi:hypothetical protein
MRKAKTRQDRPAREELLSALWPHRWQKLLTLWFQALNYAGASDLTKFGHSYVRRPKYDDYQPRNGTFAERKGAGEVGSAKRF